jgi:3-deoxy-D-manno-octulosonic acid kinase
LHTINKKNLSIITNDELKNEINQQWFEQEYWMNQGRLLGANTGRGSTWVVKSEWGKWVLRHYFRGGLYAKINRDLYFWTGLENTRAYREFQLLAELQNLNLPSPKPVAAMVIKKGLFYRNDLIMEQIQHNMTFAQGISKEQEKNPTPLSLSTWHQIGSTIAQFHHNGIYHSDLNAHNILLSDEQVFLIDFDKGEIRSPRTNWQQDNMNRLKRSIEKITNSSCDTDLSQQWQSLLDGYHA